jgi:F0F1-type ATP synthase epsilon subunit
MAVDAFELEIVSKHESKKVTVVWIEIESPNGDFLVGPDHSPLVSQLKKPGKLRFQEFNGPEKSYDVFGGLFKISNNKAIAILD